MRDYLSVTVVLNSGIWEGVLTWAKSKGILCLRCAERHGQPLFVALLCVAPRSPSSALFSPLLSSLPADLNPITTIPTQRPERRLPIT